MRIRAIIPAALALSSIAVAGGGFWISTYSGRAPIAAGIPDAVVVVAAEGCGGGAGATLTGTAEGLINGKRQSVAVAVTSTSKPGVFVVRKQWPSEGVWVLLVTAHRGSISTSTLVELRGDGEAKLAGRTSLTPVSVTPAEIEAALARLAAEVNPT